MKELINDLVLKSGMNNKQFASFVGTSTSYLSQQKRQSSINVILLTKWAKMLGIEVIESDIIKINVK